MVLLLFFFFINLLIWPINAFFCFSVKFGSVLSAFLNFSAPPPISISFWNLSSSRSSLSYSSTDFLVVKLLAKEISESDSLAAMFCIFCTLGSGLERTGASSSSSAVFGVFCTVCAGLERPSVETVGTSLSVVDFAVFGSSGNVSFRVFCTFRSGLERPRSLTNLSAVTSSKPNRWTSPYFITSEMWNDSSFSVFCFSSPQGLHGSAEGICWIFSSSMNCWRSSFKVPLLGLFLSRFRISASLSFCSSVKSKCIGALTSCVLVAAVSLIFSSKFLLASLLPSKTSLSSVVAFCCSCTGSCTGIFCSSGLETPNFARKSSANASSNFNTLTSPNFKTS